jgi:hypothetical protein
VKKQNIKYAWKVVTRVAFSEKKKMMMNNKQTTRRLVPFFTIQNDVILDF